ncbi:hypothetical protein AA21952_3431 [Acetobacter oeni LMG 21952]|nr:hypothetical protein AA21952_3431 [Acetobacter oeni LMG 21952]
MQADKAGLKATVKQARTDTDHETTKDRGINPFLKIDARVACFGELTLQPGTLRRGQRLSAHHFGGHFTTPGSSHGGKSRQNFTQAGQTPVICDHTDKTGNGLPEPLMLHHGENGFSGIPDIETGITEHIPQILTSVNQTGERISL